MPSTPEPTASATAPAGVLHPVGEPAELWGGLESPWSIAIGADGTVLVSERGTARIRELLPGGGIREVGTVPGVAPQGEAGLLGIALHDDWLYAYRTAAEGNEVVRMGFDGTALGAPEVILDGIAKAGNHDGGRVKFGPDGMLYVSTGDAGVPERAQDPESLNGKILRMTPDGGVPADNPVPGSLVYSSGHRNVQGLAWIGDQLWASEFGQNTWDELNRIEPGGDYGWPEVEGQAGDARFVDPVLQWRTSDASPSGLAAVGSTLYLAALRGERVWQVDIDPATGAAAPTALWTERFGRVRDAVSADGASLWFMTNNTDGRGRPRPGDDRVYRVELAAP